MSHSDRSLGSGNWRTGNKKPFGCWFILLPWEAGALPPCFSLPLPVPLLSWISEELVLNTTLSPLTSSLTEQAALLPNLQVRGSSKSVAPAASRTGRVTAATSTQGQKGEREVSCEGSSPGHSTTADTQADWKGEAPNITDQVMWLLSFLHLFHPFSPPEITERLCFPWTWCEAGISKIWSLKEDSGKKLCGGKIRLVAFLEKSSSGIHHLCSLSLLQRS